jgi:hypothetical protein
MDLHKHSQFAEEMGPELVMEAKMAFADNLRDRLRSLKLAKLCWAGDGGVYWIEWIRIGDSDAVVRGGELVFEVLRDVNSLYARRFPDDRELAIRVSGHYGWILTVPDPGLWHSSDLNWFMKGERRLSEPGRFSITAELRNTLSQEQREKFPEHLRQQAEIDHTKVDLYFHKNYGAPG